MRHATALAVLLLAGPAFAAGVLAEPLSYTKPVGERFVFVMRGDPAAEDRQPADAQRQFRELRAKYPKTGLYKADSAELVWALADDTFAPYSGVFPAADGVHLVRQDGEWWRTEDYPGKARLPADEERRQLDAPALSFFAGGKLVRQYALRELVDDPAALPHSPRHVLWRAGSVLNEDARRFVQFTQDSTRVEFDYTTGDVVGRSKVGLGNPLARGILLAAGVLAAAVLAAWAWLAFGRRRKPAEGTATAHLP